MTKALDVAKYILNYNAIMGDTPITNLKLQKLLYYAQGWSFVDLGQELFEDDISAWKYGPVVENVYQEYKNFKNYPIEVNIKKDFDNTKFSNEQIEFLNNFYKNYIYIPAFELVVSSHSERPWKETYKNGSGENNIISKKLIEEFFIEWSNNPA